MYASIQTRFATRHELNIDRTGEHPVASFRCFARCFPSVLMLICITLAAHACSRNWWKIFETRRTWNKWILHPRFDGNTRNELPQICCPKIGIDLEFLGQKFFFITINHNLNIAKKFLSHSTLQTQRLWFGTRGFLARITADFRRFSLQSRDKHT